jgi:translation initiation factor 2 subunit 1
MAEENTEEVAPTMEDNLSCRMYANKYPVTDELVMVQVKNLAEMGAYVSLLEYGGIEGMILHSELSRRRIRSIKALIRVGKMEVVSVMRVDDTKGYIDLSKKRVSPEDSQLAEDRYNKSKAVHSIMRHVSESTQVPLQNLYQMFGWDLYKRFPHAHDAFIQAVKDEAAVLGQYNIPPKVKSALMAIITRKLTAQPIKIRAIIQLTCFSYEGIDAIKSALRAAIATATEAEPIKISLIAPPDYVMTTVNLDLQAGIAFLNAAIAAASERVAQDGGSLRVKQAPKSVTESDELSLQALLAKSEKENAEVAGDDPEED